MKNWVNESIFYQIYPLGFCGAPQFNDMSKEPEPRIKKIIEWIPHLKDLGVNALYLGPIFESTEHGYDTADYRLIDRRLGTNEDFKEVSDKLHQNGIKVILDGVFNHVGRDFNNFKDVQANLENSKYCSWFSGLNFNCGNPMGDPFTYDAWEGHYNLVKLNLKNREVVDYLLESVAMWMDEFKIDGLRLDAADCVDMDFFRELRRFCKGKKEDFWLMGEIIHGDYSRWANDEMLDSVTNYECYKGIYSSHNDKNYFEIAHSLMRQFGNGGIYRNIYTYNFVDNHDVNRVASTVRNKAYLKNIYTVLYTMPGVPSIYYGSEYAIEGVKENGSDANLRPELNLDNLTENELTEHIKKLGVARKNSDALKYGDFEQVIIRNEQLVYKRCSENQIAYVLLNVGEQDFYANFNINSNKKLKEVLGEEEIIEANNSNVDIKVAPYSSRILVEVDA